MLDHTCCVFSANMRRASSDAICEPNKIASLHESSDFADEVCDGAGCPPSLLAGSLGCSLEGVGDRSCTVGEELEGQGIGGGSFIVNVGGASVRAAVVSRTFRKARCFA
jgi:hypothetical protein